MGDDRRSRARARDLCRPLHGVAVNALQPPDYLSRFLWSIGKRAEAEFYLALFRAEAKERFAAIAVDGPVVALALDALVVDLRFLAELGLVPIVLLGLLDASDAENHAIALAEH